jgi:hypothetical protein
MTPTNQAPSKTLKHAITYLLDSYLHGSWPSDTPYVSSIQDASDILGETLNRHFPRQPVKAGRSKAAKARKSLHVFEQDRQGYYTVQVCDPLASVISYLRDERWHEAHGRNDSERIQGLLSAIDICNDLAARMLHAIVQKEVQ